MEQCSKSGASAHFCAICDIRSKSICAEMTDEEIRIISRTMAHHAVSEGQALITQGEICEYLYVVISGSYRLVTLLPDGRRQITGFVFPGDFLGAGATGESPVTAEALEPGLVCRFSQDFLAEMSQRHPGIKDRLLSRAETELTRARTHIVVLGKQTAEEKVLSFLQLMEQARRGRDRATGRIYLPMARQDIADYLGLRLETLSRTLAALKKAGTLASVSGRFVEMGERFEIVTG